MSTKKSRALFEELGVDIEVIRLDRKGLRLFNRLKAVCFLPTYFDALPTSVLEAMACGPRFCYSKRRHCRCDAGMKKTGFILEDQHPRSDR